MLLELFALPGAGKTTVAQAAAQQSSVTTRKMLSAAWVTNSVPQRATHVGRAFLNRRHLATAIRFGWAARISTVESVFRLARLVAKTDWLRSQRNLVLLDQGFLQDLWSILISGKSGPPRLDVLASFIAALYQGMETRIFVLEIDPLVVASRISGREHGDSRFDGLPHDQLRWALDTGNELLYRIVEAARLAGMDVRTLDGSISPDQVADELLSQSPACAGKLVQGTHARRISVIGATGSGKTYLARQLAEALELPLYALDQLHRDDGRAVVPVEAFQALVAGIASKDEWIVDGHYRAVRQLIWSQADLVVWLNYPLRVVGARLLRRFISKHGPLATALDVPEHESFQQPDSVTRVSASWAHRFRRLVRTLRERREYGRVLRSPEYRNLRVVELTSVRMTRRWLKTL